MAVIETHELRKRYKGVEALRGVSLKVEPGEIFGLLGQNGAGKTTLIKILLGIVRRGEGEALLFNEPAGTASVRNRVGYLPEDHRFPEYHSAYSLLDFYGQLYGMAKDDRRRRIPEILDRVGLAQRMHYKIRTYSKGMKQRTGFAQAIFHDPDMIFLDEPTDGVDPVGRREIREMIEEQKKRGATVFVNSHLLGEIELMCDRVAIMHRGELIREGTVADLTRQRGTFVVGLAETEFPKEELLRKGYSVKPLGERWEVILPDDHSVDVLLDYFRERGLHLRHLVEKRQTLEDYFVSTLDSRGDDKPRSRKDRKEYDR